MMSSSPLPGGPQSGYQPPRHGCGEMVASLKGAVFLLSGAIVLVGCVYCGKATLDFLHHSETVPGLVIAENYGPHHVEIRFRSRSGRTVRYAQNGDVTLHKGERIMVRYDRRDPTRGPSLDTWRAIWGPTNLLALLGGGFTIMGLCLLRPRMVRYASRAFGLYRARRRDV